MPAVICFKSLQHCPLQWPNWRTFLATPESLSLSIVFKAIVLMVDPGADPGPHEAQLGNRSRQRKLGQDPKLPSHAPRIECSPCTVADPSPAPLAVGVDLQHRVVQLNRF